MFFFVAMVGYAKTVQRRLGFYQNLKTGSVGTLLIRCRHTIFERSDIKLIKINTFLAKTIKLNSYQGIRWKHFFLSEDSAFLNFLAERPCSLFVA